MSFTGDCKKINAFITVSLYITITLNSFYIDTIKKDNSNNVLIKLRFLVNS